MEDRREPTLTMRKDHEQEQDQMPDSKTEYQDIMLPYHHVSRYEGDCLSTHYHE